MVLFMPNEGGGGNVLWGGKVDLRIKSCRQTKLSLTTHTSRVIMCLQFRINQPSRYYAAHCASLMTHL